MEILAHRGRTSPHELGNSLKNFISAYNLGVTAIEADLSFTADKKAIIYHPASTDPNLVNMNWRDIDNSVFNVMDLRSFLGLIKSFSNIICCLDIKQNSEELVKKAVEMISYNGLQNQVYLTAFQKRSRILNFETGGELLIHAKRLNPDIRTHLIATLPFNLTGIVKKYNPDAISFGWLPNHKVSQIFFKMLVKPFADLENQIKEVKKMGIAKKMEVKVWAGIFNTTEDMEYFAHLGVDGIMTDNAILGMKFKRELDSKKTPQ